MSTQANYLHLRRDIYQLERNQRAATRLAKGVREPTYEEGFRAHKFHIRGKRKLRNDAALTHKMINGQIDPQATHLLKFSRRPISINHTNC